MRFPPRYRGAFERQLDRHLEHDAGQRALGQGARDMLERELGPEAASRFIDVVERMAAASAFTAHLRTEGIHTTDYADGPE